MSATKEAPKARRRHPSAMAWWRGIVASGICLATIAIPTAASSAGPSIKATFKVNGRSISGSSDSNPIKLDPTQPAAVELTVINNGSAAVNVIAVSMIGRALDVSFFNYETQVALTVPAGSTQTEQFNLDFAALNGDGDGLIPASLRILGDHRAVLASQGFTADVRGRVTSAFGLFAIEVTVVTALLFAGALLALVRDRLSENRFRRGFRFLWPGAGIGLVIVFALAVVRVFAPSPGRWLPIVVICGLAGFGAGYMTPAPARGDDGDDGPAEGLEPEGDPDLGDSRTTLQSTAGTGRTW